MANYVVTVDFQIAPEHIDAFMPLMLENARLSRQTEPGCLLFDVCRPVAAAADHAAHVFLYEVYTDAAAFNQHLRAAHFTAFSTATAPWVVSKVVRTYHQLS